MAPRRSKVWKFFKQSNKHNSTCKICFKQIKTSGNTTNMVKHLKNHGPQFKQYSQIDESEPESEEDSEQESEQDVNEEPGVLKLSGGQLSIKECFNRRSLFAAGGVQHANLTKSLLRFICVDGRAFDILKGRGFQHFVKQLCPSFNLPSVDTMKARLNVFYEVNKENFVHVLAKVEQIAITCDIWTEGMTCRSFLGITAHFLENNCLRGKILATVELSERHTSECIASQLEATCQHFGIDKKKISCIVTDNAANMVAAINHFVGANKHLPCFAHTLNLAMESIIKIPELASLCEQVRNIVKFFKNSVFYSDELRKKQDGSPLKLILDVKSRWNSAFFMLERFVKLAPVVHQIIAFNSKTPAFPSALQLETVEQIVNVLKPMEFVTNEISGEIYVTVSKIIPIIRNLRAELSQFTKDEHEITRLVKDVLCQEVDRRFKHIENNVIIAISCLLDPRFKKVPFRDPIACSKAVSRLYDLARTSIDRTIDVTEFVITVEEEDSKYDFWAKYKELAQRSAAIRPVSDISEISLYLSSSVSPLNCEPLEEWDNLKTIYPSLYKIAREYLHIPATSVPSERLFSKAGNTITKLRNRLAGKS